MNSIRRTVKLLSLAQSPIRTIVYQNFQKSTLIRFPSLNRNFSSKSYPDHVVVKMPALSPTMTQGNIGTWQKQIGDECNPGDVLVEIETDKAQMDFECQEEGYLAQLLVPSGSKDVTISTPIAVLVENKEDVEAFKDFKVEESATPAAVTESEQVKETKSEIPVVVKQETVESSPVASTSGRTLASPLAKTLAAEHGIPISKIPASGPGGRVTKEDVEKFIASGGNKAKAQPALPTATTSVASPIAVGQFKDIPLTNMRKVIASRLLNSKQTVPHYYLTQEINMSAVQKTRSELNAKAENAYKLSVNDFVIKASALACRDVPECNSAWAGEYIRQYSTVDVCVAVATEGGLITPIVTDADKKGLSTISASVKDLAGRAKENKLAPHEYQGGTFTISNLGMFGITQFCAIVNPPQSCILAVGGTNQMLVPADNENGFVVASVMNVTLSCDHRVVDGAVGAKWLQKFKSYLEDPLKMML